MAASRSLKATQDGINQIKKALTTKQWGHEDLAKEAKVVRSTAINFCTGKSVDRKNFALFCELLDLDWETISGNSVEGKPKASPTTPLDIDALVETLRDQGRADIQSRCGTMRVLDMTQPIDTNSIYTDVNILEKVMGKTRAEIGQLMYGWSSEKFDRFFLGDVRHKRVDGLEAINRYNLLMILGRPGAGKTTFLKRLAMLCSLGEQFADRVPIFVTLKEFADKPDKPGLLDFIGKAETAQILSSGRGLVLLDGLDEVQEAEHDRVSTKIRDFARCYDKNIIIITCRIAAREYIFEKFTEVEVADFNKEQIENFVKKWFRLKNVQQAKLFLERLKTSDPVKELATNPLLLTLLCLEFEEASDFPASRAELYQRGLNVLLTKWDGQRGIKRDVVYKKLSTKRKESLLGKLAMQTFKQGDYFFKQVVAEQHVSQYIQNLPDASSDSEALMVDSHAVLKAIESQHGLLVERATGIYSFSHLTFHEYFVAKYLVEHPDRERILKQLLEHAVEKRWREVFLLVTEQLEPADALLQKLKEKTDEILKADKQCQTYLAWVKTKSSSVQEYKPAAIRAYYYTLALPFLRDQKLSLSIDRVLQCSLSIFPNLSHILSISVDRALTLSHSISCDLENASSLSLILNRDLAIKHNKNSVLNQKIQSFISELPSTSEEKCQQFQAWWKAKGQDWTKRLRQAMVSHCNIGQMWKFTDEQTQRLQQYHDVNQLLVDCLNSECYVSRSVREEIEETLLLPIAEIEKWKREHRP